MPRPNHELHFDFETYCELDLPKVGLHRYVAHPSFEVRCVAWKLDDRPVLSTYTMIAQRLPPALIQALKDPTVQGHAHNAAFETAVLERLGVFIANPLSCTMQRCLAYGLPGKLEKACAALGVPQQKDMIGHRLMLRMSRPLKPDAPAWKLADYQRLAAYCAADVEAEAALAAVIPELAPEERELSVLDNLMNTSGELGIDFDRVLRMRDAAEIAKPLDGARCAELTGGAVTSPGTQTARLLKWLSLCGYDLPDVARATVEGTLAEMAGTVDYDPEVAEVLQIRLRTARASNSKLAAMLHMADPETRAVRGQFQFYGAARTGRWSGRGIQVQNLPRIPKGFRPDAFHAMAHDPLGLDVVAPAPLLDCVSWSLRSCLKATDDERLLWGFDFAQIEARVLAWLAGQSDVLDVFASGQDVYVWAAAQFGSRDRALGKVLILALGYGMGATKLRETARKNYGVVLTEAQAESFKSGWRASNRQIVRFWSDMEFAAKQAVVQRGKTFAVNGSGVAFLCTARTLQMRLPSGRVLYYHQPSIDRDSGKLHYYGTELGRWAQLGTWGGKLAENATQAAARDIMAEAMLRVWRRLERVPVMTVHDELVYALRERMAARCGATLHELMLEAPPWAGGLPIAGESKIMSRYGVAAAGGGGVVSAVAT